MIERASLRANTLDRELATSLDRPGPGEPAAADGYLRDLGERPRLSQAAERELVIAAREGDRRARGRLLEAFLPLIAAVARAYRGSGAVDRMELLQEGAVGLLRAVERYDPDLGTPFWAYASWWVRQAMQQLVAELTGPVVLSDRALRRLARLKDVHRDHMRAHGCEPSIAVLAERAGLTTDQVEDLLAAELAPRSLEEPVRGEDGEVGAFGELLADPLAEHEYERVLGRIEAGELRALLGGLSDREREVVRARYGIDEPERSLRELGSRLGLSAERVRQIEQRALGKLRAAAAAGAAPVGP